MDAALAALLGAAIGTVGSLGGAWLLQRNENRRDRIRVAAQLGLENYRATLGLAQNRGGGAIPPLSVFVAYHAEVLEALGTGTYTPERIAEIEQRQTELIVAASRRKNRDDGTS